MFADSSYSLIRLYPVFVVSAMLYVGTANISIIAGESNSAPTKDRIIEHSKVLFSAFHDFGLVHPGSKPEYTFCITNPTKNSWRIHHFQSSCACTVASGTRNIVPPGATTAITILYRPGAEPRDDRRTVVAILSEPPGASGVLTIQAAIRKELSIQPEQPLFEVLAGANTPSYTFLVNNFSEAPWSELNLSSNPPHWLTTGIERVPAITHEISTTPAPTEQWKVSCAVDAPAMPLGSHYVQLLLTATVPTSGNRSLCASVISTFVKRPFAVAFPKQLEIISTAQSSLPSTSIPVLRVVVSTPVEWKHVSTSVAPPQLAESITVVQRANANETTRVLTFDISLTPVHYSAESVNGLVSITLPTDSKPIVVPISVRAIAVGR